MTTHAPSLFGRLRGAKVEHHPKVIQIAVKDEHARIAFSVVDGHSEEDSTALFTAVETRSDTE